MVFDIFYSCKSVAVKTNNQYPVYGKGTFGIC